MRRIIVWVGCLLMFSSAFADGAALQIRIKDPVKQNQYFLCLYGIGCLSIKAGNHGKVFRVPAMDMGNILKLVITDTSDMSMYTQASAPSCDVKLTDGQVMTIEGELVVERAGPRIKHLGCRVSTPAPIS